MSEDTSAVSNNMIRKRPAKKQIHSKKKTDKKSLLIMIRIVFQTEYLELS